MYNPCIKRGLARSNKKKFNTAAKPRSVNNEFEKGWFSVLFMQCKVVGVKKREKEGVGKRD
jgi:hypothetical protein